MAKNPAAQARQLGAAMSTPAGQPADSGTASRTYHISVANVDVTRLADDLARWYRANNRDAQIIDAGSSIVVQSKDNLTQRALGVGVALSVALRSNGVEVTAEIGMGAWVGKAVGGIVAGVLFFPAATGPVVGLYRRWKLPRETVNYLKTMAPVRQFSTDAAGSDPVQQADRRQPDGALLDANTATADQLAHHLGQVAAGALIQARVSGPFRSVDDLRQRLPLRPHELMVVLGRLTVTTPAPPFSSQPRPGGADAPVI
jgi:hypothetical protein